MRRVFVLVLIAAVAALGLLAEGFASGAAAAVQTLFYLVLLVFVIGVLRILIPPRDATGRQERR